MSRPTKPRDVLPRALQRLARERRVPQQVKTFTFTDDDGRVRCQVGYQPDDGAWGVRAWDENGDLQVDQTA